MFYQVFYAVVVVKRGGEALKGKTLCGWTMDSLVAVAKRKTPWKILSVMESHHNEAEEYSQWQVLATELLNRQT